MKILNWIIVIAFVLSIGGLYGAIMDTGLSNASPVAIITFLITGSILYIQHTEKKRKTK